MSGTSNIYYWKSDQQEEVDFLVKQGPRIKQLIQVCYDFGNIKTKDREIRALLKGSKELGCKDLLVLTENYEAEEVMNWFGMREKVKFTPLWKWLLNPLQGLQIIKK